MKTEVNNTSREARVGSRDTSWETTTLWSESAGATRVVNPYRHGGRLMAQQLLQPNVTEFIDVISKWGGADLSLEEIQLQAGSSLAGVALREAPIRSELNVIVVGLRRAAQGFIFNPSSDQSLEAGDIMIVLGRRENLRILAQTASGPKS